MKKLTLLILSTVLLIGSQRAHAWCMCWDGFESGICVGTDWTPIPGTIVQWDTTNVIVTTYDYTGGCTYFGQPVPSNPTACNNTASISATQCLTWTFSGNMGSAAEGATFGVTGSQSTTYAVAASCGGPTPLNGFCQSCASTSYLTWHNKSEDAICTCSDMFGTCSETQTGTLTTFTGLHCVKLPSKPPQPCSTTCPEG